MADDVTHPQRTRLATKSSKLALSAAAAAISLLYIAVSGTVPVDLVTANCGCLLPKLVRPGNSSSRFTVRRVIRTQYYIKVIEGRANEGPV